MDGKTNEKIERKTKRKTKGGILMGAMDPASTVVGFVGTGVMGASMARHVMRAGYAVRVYNRSRAKAEPLLAEGAIWDDTVGSLAASSSVVITMVGYPADVEAVYFSPEGILASAKPGTYLVDMTTSSPELASRIARAARERGLHALDAPVSGGDRGAREGTLSIMVGGEAEDLETLRPLLETMGKQVVLQGPAGSGQHTKMANQIAIAAGMIGVCEALAYAQRASLDPDTVLQSIAGGAAGSWTLSNLAPRMLAGDFRPGFYVKHFIKDMNIALESAASMGLSTPGLALARELYGQLAEAGGEEQGTQALFRLFSDRRA